jgi:pimeloyl-ACP methyl ester carboxylesterase
MSDASVLIQPYLFQPESGPALAAEWGHLNVPENRSHDSGRRVTIPFVRFRSTSKDPGPPIVFLQGGPGWSPLSNLSRLWTAPMFRPPLEIADFIFIEHRGFGFSHPCLDCPGSYDLPLDEPASPEGNIEAHRNYLSRAVSFWQELGIDLAGYNAREMAADIDDLRQELGYDTVSLLGGSFGSHHGLAILRYYEEFIDRAMLWSVEGPNHTVKLPGAIQAHVEKLGRLLRQDAGFAKQIPDLLELMASVLDRLEKAPLTVETVHPQTKAAVDVVLGKYDLQIETTYGMGSIPFLRALPARYLAMARGDFSWLAEQVIDSRIGIDGNLMSEATDCASGATEERMKQIAQEAGNTLLGDAIDDPFPYYCDVFGDIDLGDDFRGDLHSDVPLLLVGGSLDTRTPIENAKSLLPGLSNGRLITIEGVSHDLARRGTHIEEFVRLRNRFFRGESLAAGRLESAFAFDPYR